MERKENKDPEMENVYHCDSIELEKILNKNNIELDDNLLEQIISKLYCFHIIKKQDGTRESCKRHRKFGIFCGKHAKKYCFYCNKNVKLKDTYCHLHDPKNIITNNFNFKGNTIEFPFLYCNSKFYNRFELKYKIVIVEHNDYSNDLTANNSVLTKYFDIKKYLYNVYIIFEKYNINNYIKNRKTDKKMSIFQKKEENKKPLIPFTPASKLLSYDNSSSLPPLPPQTNDEILLLSYNVIYDTEKKNKECFCDSYKDDNNILKSENEKLKIDIKEKDNKLFELKYNIEELGDVNEIYFSQLKNMEKKIQHLNKDNDALKVNLNKKLDTVSLEPFNIQPKKINEVKMLKHDIYFLKKDINEKNKEINNYKKEYNELMKFITEKGFKNIFELEKFIDDKTKPDLNNNIEKYKEMYKDILIEKHNINKDIYDTIIYFTYLLKIILNLVDSKTLPITIILKYIKKSFFKTMLDYINKNKNINFEEEIKILNFIYKMYDKTYYNTLFDSDGIRRGDEVVTHNWKNI